MEQKQLLKLRRQQQSGLLMQIKKEEPEFEQLQQREQPQQSYQSEWSQAYAQPPIQNKVESTEDAFNATSNINTNSAEMSSSNVVNQLNASSLDKQMAALATTSLKVLNISSAAIARLIGDNGSNIDKVREATGAEVELEEQNTREEEETTTLKIRLKGSGEAVRNAFHVIELLLKNHNLLIAEIVDRVLASHHPSTSAPPPSRPHQTKCPPPSGTHSGTWAKHIVREAIEEHEKVHPSGKILFFDGSVPWKRNFFELEQELGLWPAGICLAIYRANTDGNWRVEPVPIARQSQRKKRILLPWKGMQDAELEAESGIQGAYFVDPSGSIGGAKTIEAAMEMAEQTLKLNGDLSAPSSRVGTGNLKFQGDETTKHIIREAIEKREKVHPSGKILLFDQTLPWKRNFFEIEKELGLGPASICLTIYRANTDGNWRLEAIPVKRKNQHKKRILLPWKGMQDAELEAESGIQGAYFVDSSGSIGGAKTIEAAMEMAEQTLKSRPVSMGIDLMPN